MTASRRLEEALSDPSLQEEVLRLYALGHASDKIATWLVREKGIAATGRGVRDLLSSIRDERSNSTKALLRDKLGKTTLSDIDVIERIRLQISAKAEKWEERAEADSESAMVWLRFKEAELKALERKLHYAGADTPDNTGIELAAAGERVASKLAFLLSERKGMVLEAEPSGEGSAGVYVAGLLGEAEPDESDR